MAARAADGLELRRCAGAWALRAECSAVAAWGSMMLLDLTCRHCRHSAQHQTPRGLVLWCAQIGGPAQGRCSRFEYEPGTE